MWLRAAAFIARIGRSSAGLDILNRNRRSCVHPEVLVPFGREGSNRARFHTEALPQDQPDRFVAEVRRRALQRVRTLCHKPERYLAPPGAVAVAIRVACRMYPRRLTSTLRCIRCQTPRRRFKENLVNVHFLIAAELVRQRNQEIARSVENCRPLPSPRRRWWVPGFLRHPAVAHDVPSPASGRVAATA